MQVSISRVRNGRVETVNKKVELKTCPKGTDTDTCANKVEARMCARIDRRK